MLFRSGSVVEDGILLVDECSDERNRKAYRHWLVASVDDVAAILRVQVAEMLYVDVQHLGYLLNMYVLVHFHGVRLHWQLGYHRTDVVVAIIVHDVVGCDEGWHISACLLGEVGIDVPVIGRTFGAVDSLVDLVGSTVVGSDDKARSEERR